MSDIKFFKDLKLKPHEMNEVCAGLKYDYCPKDSFVINYGEQGDMFYIILKGKVSVWVPCPNENMHKPLR